METPDTDATDADSIGKVVPSIGMRLVMDDVAKFMRAGDQAVLRKVTVPAIEVIDLRYQMVDQEVNEELLPAIECNDLVGIADGIADSIYVLVGMAHAYGIPLDAVWAIVCSKNDAKIGPDGKVTKNEVGKIMKPEGWTPPEPQIAAIMGVPWPPAATGGDAT